MAEVQPEITEEEEEGFLCITAAHHQRAIEIFWLHFWGALTFVHLCQSMIHTRTTRMCMCI